LSVVGGFVLLGWDVVKMAVQAAIVVPVTHSIVYSTSSMVFSGPVRNSEACPPDA